MIDISAGTAVETLIKTYLERRPPALQAMALALALAEPDAANAASVEWRIQCAVGITPVASQTLAITTQPESLPHAEQHPILLAARAGQTVCGGPISGTVAALAGSHWCATPAIMLTGAEAPRAILLGIATTPIAAEHVVALERLAENIAALLGGAEAALRQRRESDQLALLMSYAANPIILSEGGAIINMNGPALHLFDVESATEGDNLDEQRGLIAQNLARLQTFLGEVKHDPNAIHTGELALQEPRTQEDLIMAIACTHVPHDMGGEHTIVSVLHDMTRARELEQHRVRQQLFESEKMAATGRLAASIAHEINNPLEAIKNSLYLIVQQTDEDDPNRQFLELAQRETERVSRIIRQMLGVSRPSVTFAATQVNDILHDALQLLGPQLRQGRVTPNIQLAADLPRVRASADQLKQVFLNLLLNAREAMPNGGELLVQTRIAHEGDSEFLAGRHVIVRIRDDGAGIAADILPHVFEPFFSTKAEHHGTGLGLWVCQDIIQHHNGQILVRSMVDKGTTFLVALPFIPAPPPEHEGALR